MNFVNAATTVDHGQLGDFAGSIRQALEAQGHQGVSDAP